mmetsp:Transcript_16792/g.21820  ORF Transcript_16792/g.21820 Transcript_16792/m.21820 type:complete len:362 (+) Transcript_16792:269-1354(+)
MFALVLYMMIAVDGGQGIIAKTNGIAALSTGANLPYVSYCNEEKGSKAKILLLHGSLHDLRCYEEWWLPELASRGYEATAISLRGTHESTVDNKRVEKVKISDHVKDVRAFLKECETSAEVFLAAHSFGGPIAMELLRLQEDNCLAGVCCLCSVPPSGNTAMTMRTIRKSWQTALLITRGFALKTAAYSNNDARQLFFAKDKSISEQKMNKYVSWFQQNSISSLDLRDFQKNLPSRFADTNGKAKFIHDSSPPRLVLGAANDPIVDSIAIEETATFLAVEPQILQGLPHDIMLASDWIKALDALDAWINLCLSSRHASSQQETHDDHHQENSSSSQTSSSSSLNTDSNDNSTSSSSSSSSS